MMSINWKDSDIRSKVRVLTVLSGGLVGFKGKLEKHEEMERFVADIETLITVTQKAKTSLMESESWNNESGGVYVRLKYSYKNIGPWTPVKMPC